MPLVGKPEPIGVTASPPWWRWNDTSPYWGGARIGLVGGGWCTNGFSVVDSEGYPSTLTAVHCGPLGTEVYTPFDGGYKFGQLWWTWASHDIGLIWIYHGNVGGIVTPARGTPTTAGA